jgi:hypothetical protein
MIEERRRHTLRLLLCLYFVVAQGQVGGNLLDLAMEHNIEIEGVLLLARFRVRSANNIVRFLFCRSSQLHAAVKWPVQLVTEFLNG